MESGFIYLEEDTKFWIVSSVVGLAILILIFLAGFDVKNHNISGVENSSEIKYYSRILGLESTEAFWYSDIFRIDLQSRNNWQRGDIAYAANIK
jgi:hypothetical protein